MQFQQDQMDMERRGFEAQGLDQQSQIGSQPGAYLPQHQHQVVGASVLCLTTLYSQLLLHRSRLYRNSHIPDREFQSLEKAYSMFCTVWLFGYTGFVVCRTLNLSPNQSSIRAIDCMYLQYFCIFSMLCKVSLLF